MEFAKLLSADTGLLLEWFANVDRHNGLDGVAKVVDETIHDACVHFEEKRRRPWAAKFCWVRIELRNAIFLPGAQQAIRAASEATTTARLNLIRPACAQSFDRVHERQ